MNSKNIKIKSITLYIRCLSWNTTLKHGVYDIKFISNLAYVLISGNISVFVRIISVFLVNCYFELRIILDTFGGLAADQGNLKFLKINHRLLKNIQFLYLKQ